MHLFSICLGLGLMLLSLSSATPFTNPTELVPVKDTGSAIQAAKAAGIDPFGAVPSDYSSYVNGVYYFAAESKVAKWVHAQIEIDHTNATAAKSFEKRLTLSGIAVGMFTGDFCSGSGAWVVDVAYSKNYYSPHNYHSVAIVYRGLRNNERLDFSRLSGKNWCGDYLYSAPPDTPIECFNSQLIDCFSLHLT